MGATLFGKTPDGAQVWMCELRNASGMSVEVLTLGATIHRILVPDRGGKAADVILGKDGVEGYLSQGALAAATIGRVANRIQGHGFTLGGKAFELDANEGGSTLHGGSGNYALRAFALVEATGATARMAARDFGEGGFPGEVAAEVAFTLKDDDSLLIEYTAIPTRDTPINLTNHVYFNLAGHASGAIDSQELQIEADFYTPTDRDDIPTGEIAKVAGTPFDFTSPRNIGEAMKELAAHGDWHGGFDHNYVLRGTGWRKIAVATDPASGRAMEVYTDLPGVQLYTANKSAPSAGKGGAQYGKHGGFCLETQYFPDSIHRAHFPSSVVAAGAVHRTSTAYRFISV
ncbi:MAG: galactose mutarotase [Clostridiales bacterium]|jgi:aldose 1-epimerase|nr:galactose mutarotase [Clostridiales bacterium]